MLLTLIGCGDATLQPCVTSVHFVKKTGAVYCESRTTVEFSVVANEPIVVCRCKELK